MNITKKKNKKFTRGRYVEVAPPPDSVYHTCTTNYTRPFTPSTFQTVLSDSVFCRCGETDVVTAYFCNVNQTMNLLTLGC